MEKILITSLITAIAVATYLIVVIPKGLGNLFGNILMGTNTPPPKILWKEFFCQDIYFFFCDTTKWKPGWHQKMCDREKRWDRRVAWLKKFTI